MPTDQPDGRAGERKTGRIRLKANWLGMLRLQEERELPSGERFWKTLRDDYRILRKEDR